MPRTLHESDSDQPVDLIAGEEVQLVLDESPTTGFRWMVTPEAHASHYQPIDSGVGAAGYRVFLFGGFAAGDHEIHATLSRSWESRSVRERHFQLRVR